MGVFQYIFDVNRRAVFNPDQPLTPLARNAAKLFLTIALACIGLAVLIILFPLVLAIFVAALFVIVALFCLALAWKTYRASRHLRSDRSHVEVTIIDPCDHQ